MILTLDPALLAWLRTRISLWLMQVGLLVISGFGLAGCVPTTRYEEAHSAAENERNLRQRQDRELSRMREQNQALSARVEEQTRALDAREAALSQAAFDTDTAGKQRQDAEGLVEQLRSELARAGDHMRSYQSDKQRLEESLAESARVREAERFATEEKARELGRLTRDTTLALAPALAAGGAALESEASALALRWPLADRTWTKETGSPSFAVAIAGVLRQHPRIRVRTSGAELQAALVAEGVTDERFDATLAEPETPSAPGGSVDAGQATGAPGSLLYLIVP